MFKLYCLVAIATLVGHYGLNTQRYMFYADFLLKAADQKEKIQDDQVRELVSSLQQANQRNESMKTEGYVAGAMDVIDRPDHYSTIWHEGYNRGSAVQQDVMNVSLKLKSPPVEEAPAPVEEAESK